MIGINSCYAIQLLYVSVDTVNSYRRECFPLVIGIGNWIENIYAIMIHARATVANIHFFSAIRHTVLGSLQIQ